MVIVVEPNRGDVMGRSWQRMVGMSLMMLGWGGEAIFLGIQVMKIDHVVISGVDVTEEIVAGALLRSGIAFFGLLLAGGAWIGHWRVFSILSAVLYLGTWFFWGSTSSVGVIEAFSLKWQTAVTLGTYAAFLLRDVLLPSMAMLTVAISVVSSD